MKRTLKDFEDDNVGVDARSKRRKVISANLFTDYNVSKGDSEVIMDTINQDTMLKYLYEKGKLFVSCEEREAGQVNLYDWSKNLDPIRKQLLKDGIDVNYDSKSDFGKVLRKTFDALKDFRSTPLVEKYNMAAVEKLVSGGTSFGVSVEMFPVLDRVSSRSDSMSVSRGGLLRVCPNNYRDISTIPSRNNPTSLFTHEISHAIDFLLNNRKSRLELGDVIKKYFPSIDATNIADVKRAIEFASGMLPDNFLQCYDLDGITRGNKFNPEAPAAVEFLSFFTQVVAEQLSVSKDYQEFQSKFDGYITDKLKTVPASEAGRIAAAFSMDVMIATSTEYLSTLGLSDDLSDLFDGIKKTLNVRSDGVLGDVIKDTWKNSADKKSMNDALESSIESRVNDSLNKDSSLYDKSIADVTKAVMDDLFIKSLQEGLSKEIISQLIGTDSAKKIMSIRDVKRFAEITNQSVSDPLFKTIMDNSGTGNISYVESIVQKTFLQSRANYLVENSSKIQADLAQISNNMDQTSSELKNKNDELSDIKTKLQADPDNPDLKRRAQELDSEIDTLNKQAKDLEDKKAEAERKNQENEDAQKKTEEDRKKAEDMQKEKAKEIFEGK